ncbi:ATP-binding protein [Bordetella petrii]|uniref:ATP-binding protein n=1 Tax=Bordetella petrii TaxID=94624 RepID=UPI001F609065|nr:ATP-binding protein [Bordetella petrii]
MSNLSEVDEAYRYQLLVEAVMDYAIYLLDPDGYISSWNAGAARFKGYQAHEVIGKHFSCFYTEQDRAAGLPARALQTAASEGRFEAEGWRVRKDGSQFWSSVVIDPVRNASGKLLGFAKITRDITAQKQAADDLLSAREALHQSQKLEALGLLTGGVAHDFNNLLMVIRGSAELLRQPTLSDSKRQRYIDAICTTSDRAGHLTRQLLAYARKQPLRPTTFDVRNCIEGMQDLFHATTGSAVQVQYELPPDPCCVHVDRNQLETCILNIVINARDAMPSGGTLTIAVTCVDETPPTRHHGAVHGPHVAISIADTGSGIAPNVVDRVFEPFFTTKAPGHGTGLGLSQVFGFVSQSGGHVDVASTPGSGTVFTLYLAKAQPTGLEDLLSPQADISGITQRPRHKILLVDDNAEVSDIVKNLLQDLGQDVVLARHGNAALEILRQQDGAFDLVITDIVMPELNGIDLARHIQEQWPGLRIVLATGYTLTLAELGPADFHLLHKPYSIEALTKVIDAIPRA